MDLLSQPRTQVLQAGGNPFQSQKARQIPQAWRRKHTISEYRAREMASKRAFANRHLRYDDVPEWRKAI